ncbi:hypothetical protein O6P43_023512 [Quillaja saponaria]|uniref:Uncharacterized protein n=1 Tax=Quillaja saponaria TaxID=32244 RepID=A0AAD7LGY0_QUISA|nr:hypothetical protein O6P43_023512 [Quillaja saponaria]
MPKLPVMNLLYPSHLYFSTAAPCTIATACRYGCMICYQWCIGKAVNITSSPVMNFQYPSHLYCSTSAPGTIATACRLLVLIKHYVKYV